MDYWVYENWTAESKAVVHRADCGYCNHGKGCHENPLGDKNGKWHGPFNSRRQARAAAVATGRKVKYCRCLGRD